MDLFLQFFVKSVIYQNLHTKTCSFSFSNHSHLKFFRFFSIEAFYCQKYRAITSPSKQYESFAQQKCIQTIRSNRIITNRTKYEMKKKETANTRATKIHLKMFINKNCHMIPRETEFDEKCARVCCMKTRRIDLDYSFFPLNSRERKMLILVLPVRLLGIIFAHLALLLSLCEQEKCVPRNMLNRQYVERIEQQRSVMVFVWLLISSVRKPSVAKSTSMWINAAYSSLEQFMLIENISATDCTVLVTSDAVN